MRFPLILAAGLALLAVAALGNSLFDSSRRVTATPLTRPVVNGDSPGPTASPPPVGPFAIYSPPPATPTPPPPPAPPPAAAPAPPDQEDGGDN